MRIGIYNPAVGTRYSGGTETFLREMIRHLSQRHDITLYTGSGRLIPELESVDIDVVQFPWVHKGKRASSIMRKLTAGQLLAAEIESLTMFAGAGFGRRIDTDSLDVLSTHYYLDNLLLSRLVDVPTLFRFPGIRRASPRWKAMARFGVPDLYVSNSTTTADRVSRWLDVRVDGKVYAGVDVDRFNPDAEPAMETETFTALYVGRLDPGKGLFELLETVRCVRATGRDLELHLVGDGILRDELESRAEEIGVDEAVSFVGEVEHGNIHRYYVACDVFCLPSEHEGFPVVNVEAMASGLPVISTRIPAVEEQIDHGETGLLVDVGDVDALVAALSSLIDDTDRRTRLGTAARAKAVEEFTWRVQADRMEDLYERAHREG